MGEVQHVKAVADQEVSHEANHDHRRRPARARHASERAGLRRVAVHRRDLPAFTTATALLAAATPTLAAVAADAAIRRASDRCVSRSMAARVGATWLRRAWTVDR